MGGGSAARKRPDGRCTRKVGRRFQLAEVWRRRIPTLQHERSNDSLGSTIDVRVFAVFGGVVPTRSVRVLGRFPYEFNLRSVYSRKKMAPEPTPPLRPTVIVVFPVGLSGRF